MSFTKIQLYIRLSSELKSRIWRRGLSGTCVRDVSLVPLSLRSSELKSLSAAGGERGLGETFGDGIGDNGGVSGISVTPSESYTCRCSDVSCGGVSGTTVNNK